VWHLPDRGGIPYDLVGMVTDRVIARDISDTDPHDPTAVIVESITFHSKYFLPAGALPKHTFYGNMVYNPFLQNTYNIH